MAEAAEAPAAAPEDTLYHDIVASIQKTYDEEESPRGNNTASLAVHAAMARAMENVITGRNFTQDCQIDKEFVEQWARTQLLMKDKLDHMNRALFLCGFLANHILTFCSSGPPLAYMRNNVLERYSGGITY